MEGFRDYFKEKNGVQSYDEIEAAVEFFVMQEREACAKLAQTFDNDSIYEAVVAEIVKEIRERGQ